MQRWQDTGQIVMLIILQPLILRQMVEQSA